MSKTSEGKSGQRDLAAAIGQLYEFLRTFSSSALDSTDTINSHKSALARIQAELAHFDSIPDQWLTLTWRELFELQHWGGVYPDGMNPLLESVRVAWLRAQSKDNASSVDDS